MKVGDITYLRVVKIGRGVYEFGSPKGSEEWAKWMVSGSPDNLREFIEGRSDTFSLTFRKPR